MSGLYEPFAHIRGAHRAAAMSVCVAVMESIRHVLVSLFLVSSMTGSARAQAGTSPLSAWISWGWSRLMSAS